MKEIRISIHRAEATLKKKKTTVDEAKIQEEKLQNECFSYMADIASKIYESEEAREHSIVEQAGRMQAAFSFVIAAVLLLAQILISKRIFTDLFLLLSFSSITVFLLLCLLFATLAQRRTKRVGFPSVTEIKNMIIEEYQSFATNASRNKYIVDTYELMFASYEKNNNKKVRNLRLSMISFYISLGLCVLWFCLAILIKLGVIAL